MLVVTLIRRLRQGVLPVVIAIFVGVLGTHFYLRAQSLMGAQLRERLQSTASVAAAQFDLDDVRAVEGEAHAGSPAHRRLVAHLQRIRAMTPGARYAYLVRATDDPMAVEFVADADEFLPDERLDRNGDGDVDDDEAPAHPGELYDISDMTEFQAGFHGPSVDEAVTYDKWGALISGYAPIRGENGETVAVLGIDMSADEFIETARSIFSPVALLFVLVGGGMLAFFTYSVSQRRRLAALREVEIARTALLDQAAHQLGMPLATFRWWLELLRERQSSASTEDREAIDQLQLGVDRMDHIVRSLQEASSLQVGGAGYRAEPVDPESFVRDVVDAMRPAFALKRQSVTIESAPGLPAMSVDRKLLAGVLSELLENARGYSPSDSAIVVRAARDRRFVRIDVVDHGVGIPAVDLPNMFQKFSRGKKAYLSKPVGNGLGLYICKGIVERGGGTIAIDSVEGKGTVVSLFLPVA